MLQDKVLTAVFQAENNLYLTGGTCLSRFYYEERYSDDLDLFSLNSHRFSETVRNIEIVLNNSFDTVCEVSSRDFMRYKIEKSLQIDLVNDMVFRYGEPVFMENNFIIDNLTNILANKISAVIGRDNPKDIFDIYLISRRSLFHWGEILQIAEKKCSFTMEELIVRFESFPVVLFKKIHIIHPTFLINFDKDYSILIEEMKEGRSNSLNYL